MAAQDTIIAKTTVAIAAAQADLREYIKDEFAALETRVILAEKRWVSIFQMILLSHSDFRSSWQAWTLPPPALQLKDAV